MESVPSTSSSVLNHKRKQDDDDEKSNKRNRYEYNFWKKDKKPKEVKENVTIKIGDLQVSKYLENQTITFRVTFKSGIRATKVGTVFSFHGIDETSEIAIVNFGPNSSKISQEIEINNVYSITNFTVDVENVLYPSGTGNDFKVVLNSKSEISSIADNKSLPEIPINLKTIDEMDTLQKNDSVDILGILIKDFGLETNNRGTTMRDILLTDKTKNEIIATLWADEADKFKCDLFSAIIIKKGNLSEYQSKKKINCNIGTLVWCQPDTNVAKDLEIWFKQEFNKNMTEQN